MGLLLIGGSAVLQVRCPSCYAPVQTDDARTGQTARCLRCGHAFALERDWVKLQEPTARGKSTAWTVHVPAVPGRQVRRRMQRLAITRPAVAGSPACRPAFKPPRRLWSRSEWRSIGIGLIVFLGVPAALIFFLVVVCAPRGH
jgi:hypothetical protein